MKKLNQYYYIAYRKRRNEKPYQIGDGVVLGESIKHVKRTVGFQYGTAAKNVKVTLRHKFVIAREKFLERHNAEQVLCNAANAL